MTTSITRSDAYAILELPVGADSDAVRTGYKRLAQKWHPNINPKSDNTCTMFRQISLAYKRLITDSENVCMSYNQMLHLYEAVMHPKRQMVLLEDDYDEQREHSSDQDSCTTSDSENDPMSCVLNYLGRDITKKRFPQDLSFMSQNGDFLSPEEREKLANELITEEDKRKRQLEKRRLKKKQRREKKRLEKQVVKIDKKDNGTFTGNNHLQSAKSKKNKDSHHPSHSSDNDDDSDEEKLKSVDSKSSLQSWKLENIADEVDPAIMKSRQFAIQGNKMACEGQYQAAIEWFSKAIHLDVSDHRYFGNRSYCFERLDQYDKALSDACTAIRLAPDWPKGFFRKGRALAGLKNYQAAEEAFMHVIKLDSKCEDARQELIRVRSSQLMEMGFSEKQAIHASQQCESFQQALDSLLSNIVSGIPALDDVYISDEESDFPVVSDLPKTSNCLEETSPAFAHTQSATSTHPVFSAATKSQRKNEQPLPPIPQHHYEQAARQIQLNRLPAAHSSLAVPSSEDVKMNPNNPEGLTSLWVGNVSPSVTQETLYELFSKYGMLQSMRLIPEKYCAFVNYVNKECAGKAMQALQRTVCCGQQLVIKFPDNPITASHSFSDKPVRSVPAPVYAASQAAVSKVKGPVNGDECYFWRTTGCQFQNGKCRYRHIPEHKGIDRKPWQKL